MGPLVTLEYRTATFIREKDDCQLTDRQRPLCVPPTAGNIHNTTNNARAVRNEATTPAAGVCACKIFLLIAQEKRKEKRSVTMVSFFADFAKKGV